jgi:hypothetical protein
LAEHAGGALLVTAAGRQFAETREIGQALGLVPSRSRRRSCG